ncbi:MULTISPECIES: hypothetical protein [Polaromonas]|uniref:Uncharacterized protein n=1 Tax=Polaromonas aquatica TaxID=332657 RepID=A0ABW1TUK1_9BURK
MHRRLRARPVLADWADLQGSQATGKRLTNARLASLIAHPVCFDLESSLLFPDVYLFGCPYSRPALLLFWPMLPDVLDSVWTGFISIAFYQLIWISRKLRSDRSHKRRRQLH